MFGDQQRRKPFADRDRLIDSARRTVAPASAFRSRCGGIRRRFRPMSRFDPRESPGRNQIPGGLQMPRLEELKTAIDRRPGRPASACRVISSRRSVIFDMAETTATTGRLAASRAIRSHAAFIRSAEPTLVPPNFITRRCFNLLCSFPFEMRVADDLEDLFFHLFRGEARGIRGKWRRAPG